jgi:hypothetical protein
MSLPKLRTYAITRSLFAPATLLEAIERLGFVQADPIRAPARAQDLTLRHRVKRYFAGDLEVAYPTLPIEEDAFINYGFLPRALQRRMLPRVARIKWPASRWRQAEAVLAFVRARGVVHPREVDAQFSHGKVKNWFGGTSNASTQLLDGMHYRGLLRVARREGGIRLYAARDLDPKEREPQEPADALDALVDVLVAKYAPLPEASLADLCRMLRFGAPQWANERRAAFERAKKRLASTTVGDVRWYWPADEDALRARAPHERVRLLAPFDPVVWDRRRFEAFWGWPYRFEAYVPAAKRVRGYYALPLLWRDQVIGWSNLSVTEGKLDVQLGYVRGRAPRDVGFARALDRELEAMRRFLGLARQS